MAKLSVELQRYFFEEERQPEVTLSEILSLAGERIFGFLFIILSLPSALPIPAPGYSTPFGILIFLLAIQFIFGAKVPWLPEKMMKGSMKLEKVQGVVKAGIPWLKRIETIARPRMTYICTSLTGRVILGIAIALMSIVMMIIIPGTNTFPAIVIFVIGFGLQEDDGLISLGGLVISLIAAILYTSIMIAAIMSLVNIVQEKLGR